MTGMPGRDAITGLVCLAISLWLLYLTRGLPPPIMVPIGPAFYPRVVLSLTALLSILLIGMDWIARRRRLAPVRQAPASANDANYRLVLVTFLIFGLYIAVLPELGFRISTVLFMAGLQITLERPRSWRRWLLVWLIAIGTTVACDLAFEDYLSVLLPRGRWTGG